MATSEERNRMYENLVTGVLDGDVKKVKRALDAGADPNGEIFNYLGSGEYGGYGEYEEEYDEECCDPDNPNNHLDDSYYHDASYGFRHGKFHVCFSSARLKPYLMHTLGDVAWDRQNWQVLELVDPAQYAKHEKHRICLQKVLTKHVDTCLASIPGMPPMAIANIVVGYLQLPFDVTATEPQRVWLNLG